MNYKELEQEPMDDDMLDREQLKTIKQMLNSKDINDLELALNLLEGINLYKLSVRDLKYLKDSFTKEIGNKIDKHKRTDLYADYRFYARSSLQVYIELSAAQAEQHKIKKQNEESE